MELTHYDELNGVWPGLLWLAGAVVVTLAALIAGGAFDPATLRRGPERRVGWGAIELAAAGGCALLFAAPFVWSQVRPPAPGTSNPLYDVLQMLGTFAIWGGGMLFVTRLARTGDLRLGGVVPRHPWRDLGVAALGVPVAFVLATAAGTVALFVLLVLGLTPPTHGHETLKQLTDPETSVAMVVTLIVLAVVIAPLIEEFFFRGFLQTALQSVIGHEKRWLSILPVAVFFGIIHAGAVPWVMVPVLVLLGIVFGWVYERTGSLWCAVLVHAGYNATSVALSMLR